MKTVHRALVGDGKEEGGKSRARAFSGRPDLHTFQLASEGQSMSFSSYSSPGWIQHRRLAERVMREMYTSDNFWEDVIGCEARKLRDIFLGHAATAASGKDPESFLESSERKYKTERGGCAGGSFNPKADVQWSISRSMYRLCYDSGDANASSDDKAKNSGGGFQEMISRTTKLIDCHSRGNVVDFFPWVRGLLGRQEKALKALCAGMLAITRKKHAEHVTSFRSDHIRDIQDALIRHGIRNEQCTLNDEQVREI